MSLFSLVVVAAGVILSVALLCLSSWMRERKRRMRADRDMIEHAKKYKLNL